MEIVFLDESSVNLNSDIDYTAIERLGKVSLYPSTASADEIIERCRQASHIVTNKVQITSEVIMALEGLRHIAVLATGVNNVDLEAASNKGVAVTNVPSYAMYSVAQHVFTLILNLMTAIPRYHADVLNGEWSKSSSFTLLKYPTFELHGKTIGIIGFGSIGMEVAKISQAFGMKVLMNRASGLPKGGFESTPLDELVRNSDIISVNCPLTKDNKYMFDKHLIEQMKSNAILINTSRGPLVNQEDLAQALIHGRIAGAGIDVLDVEPPQSNPLLEEMPHLIVTPHSAWSTTEARQRLVDAIAANISNVENGTPKNVVNQEMLR